MTRALGSVAASLLAVLLCVATVGCVQVTRIEEPVINLVSDVELEAACPFGPEGRYEFRRVSLSDSQRAEYQNLVGEPAEDNIFFYNATHHRLVANAQADRTSGEIYLLHGVADTGRFSYFIYVSNGSVRQITLRHPNSISQWDRLNNMLKALEDTTLRTLAMKGDSPLSRAVRRALALHAVLTPERTDPYSNSKPV